MASQSQQKIEHQGQQNRAERLFARSLAVWANDVVREWRVGSTKVGQKQAAELRGLLKDGYDATAKSVLRDDWRLYKQDEEDDPYEDAMTEIAIVLGALLAERLSAASTSILSTVSSFMRRATNAANESDGGSAADRVRTAKSDLTNRMRNHRLTIAVTESTWTVNTTRSTAILSVNDPLGNSVERVAQLIEDGDINAARRLSRQVVKLSRLPTSVKQGELIRFVNDARDRMVTPIAQGRVIASLRAQAEKLGTPEKKWLTVGDSKVRSSHASANGQVREADKPFDLSGGRLQYPGDSSLGASLSEVVNCRCALQWL